MPAHAARASGAEDAQHGVRRQARQGRETAGRVLTRRHRLQILLGELWEGYGMSCFSRCGVLDLDEDGTHQRTRSRDMPCP